MAKAKARGRGEGRRQEAVALAGQAALDSYLGGPLYYRPAADNHRLHPAPSRLSQIADPLEDARVEDYCANNPAADECKVPCCRATGRLGRAPCCCCCCAALPATTACLQALPAARRMTCTGTARRFHLVCSSTRTNALSTVPLALPSFLASPHRCCSSSCRALPLLPPMLRRQTPPCDLPHPFIPASAPLPRRAQPSRVLPRACTPPPLLLRLLLIPSRPGSRQRLRHEHVPPPAARCTPPLHAS